jgi:hypothetical protein
MNLLWYKQTGMKNTVIKRLPSKYGIDHLVLLVFLILNGRRVLNANLHTTMRYLCVVVAEPLHLSTITHLTAKQEKVLEIYSLPAISRLAR